MKRYRTLQPQTPIVNAIIMMLGSDMFTYIRDNITTNDKIPDLTNQQSQHNNYDVRVRYFYIYKSI